MPRSPLQFVVDGDPCGQRFGRRVGVHARLHAELLPWAEAEISRGPGRLASTSRLRLGRTAFRSTLDSYRFRTV
ncbi:hypothetical protein [Streptomyces sp. NPDC048338]|uniref:hypothetical protein n=1 Tax=Streptomyces sp. NPDC048338 TaxID=3365536 RepID=UPI0037156681